MVTIRPIRAEDAEDFLILARILDQETSFMLLEPGERTLTVAKQREQIVHLLSRTNHTMLVAEDADRLIGYLGAAGGGAYRRTLSCRTHGYGP